MGNNTLHIEVHVLLENKVFVLFTTEKVVKVPVLSNEKMMVPQWRGGLNETMKLI